MGTRAALIAILALLVAGCGYVAEPGELPPGGVFEVTLKDGTRCAVYDGYKAGGIDCDFN